MDEDRDVLVQCPVVVIGHDEKLGQFSHRGRLGVHGRWVGAPFDLAERSRNDTEPRGSGVGLCVLEAGWNVSVGVEDA